MEHLAQQIASLAGIVNVRYALIVTQAREATAAYRTANPLATPQDVTDWFISSLDAGDTLPDQDFEDTVLEIMTAAMA